MLRLKQMLHKKGIRQVELASSLSTSEGLVAQLLNHEQWPKRTTRAEFEPLIRAFMTKSGFSEIEQSCAFESLSAAEKKQMMNLSRIGKLGIADFDPEAEPKPKPRTPKPKVEEPSEEAIMLLRKQALTPLAKRHFMLTVDPFGEVRSSDEVFMSPDIRYVREAMYSTAKDGGFIAVVGESGSGKSTVRRDLHERIEREGAQIRIIEPFIIGMEDNDMKGKTLRASHIAEAIMQELAPLEPISKSPEKRFQQLYRALRESSRSGYSHVLMIEEAHSIPIPVLKHLKRFFEMEDGFRRLLSVILIGQPELAQKLDERNPAVREVVQRCELVHLQPLDEHLTPYLQARFKRVGKDLSDVMNAEAVEALRSKLSGPTKRPGQRVFSLLYPLAVGNVVTAALNAAAAYGLPNITSDLIMEV